MKQHVHHLVALLSCPKNSLISLKNLLQPLHLPEDPANRFALSNHVYLNLVDEGYEKSIDIEIVVTPAKPKHEDHQYIEINIEDAWFKDRNEKIPFSCLSFRAHLNDLLESRTNCQLCVPE